MPKKIFKFSLIFPLLIAMLALTACAGNASASNNSSNVQITLSDFKITSSLTTFSTGVTYHFTVTNKGAVPHQMLIMPPEPDTITPEKATSDALAGLGSAGINPGETKTFDYTFKQAYPSGKLEFACHLPGHYDAGMHTPIVVK
jgi:uncharacterized cupredoxin-like copper-binding protein